MRGIIAVNELGIIGNKGFMPWHVPEDLHYFKILTLGNVLVFGRVTADGLLERGIDLPGREIWVLSRQGGVSPDEIRAKALLHSKNISIAGGAKNIFIAGGAECYQVFSSDIKTWHISLIKNTASGDTQAPDFILDILYEKSPDWRMVSRDERGSVTFFQFDRVLSNSRII